MSNAVVPKAEIPKGKTTKPKQVWLRRPETTAIIHEGGFLAANREQSVKGAQKQNETNSTLPGQDEQWKTVKGKSVAKRAQPTERVDTNIANEFSPLI